MRRRIVLALVLGLVPLAAFAWGFRAGKDRLFPYRHLTRTPAEADPQPAAAPAADSRATAVDRGRLTAHPYLGGYRPAPRKSGITVHRAALAQPGLNLVVSGHAPEALLMDMSGKPLHRWRKSFEEVWSGPLGFAEDETHRTFWRRAYVFPNGDLLAIFEGIGILKLDRDSNLLWEHQGRCHHHIAIGPEGGIYTLARDLVDCPPLGVRTWTPGAQILDDSVLVLSPEGKPLRKVSITRALLASDYASLLENVHDELDILHTNTVFPLDDRFADRCPMFRASHVLLSIRGVHAVAVLDLEAERITWALSGLWTQQHQPTLLASGNLLVLDNNGHHGRSKVVEIDPLTQEVVWSYRDGVHGSFHTPASGSAQRLANGNTLITESDPGRAFEVTPAGEVVWEYVNPERAGDRRERIATLFEVVRLDEETFRSLASGDPGR